MITIFILILSVVFQLVAAAKAIMLTRITGRRTAWSLIAAALILMSVRRVIPLCHLLVGDPSYQVDFFNEVIGLVLSFLIMIGIVGIAPLFLYIAHSEKAVREEKNKLQETLDYLDEGYYSVTLEGILLEHNKAFKRILGIEPLEDIKGTLTADFWQDKEKRTAYLDALCTKGFIRNYLIPAKKITGEEILLLVNSHLIKDEKNNPVRIEGNITDITELKRAEDALLDNERRLRLLNELGDKTRSMMEPREIMATISHLLGRHLRSSRCAYADVEADGEHFTIQYDYTDGCASTVGNYQLSSFGPRAVSELRNGCSLVIRDVEAELSPGEGTEMFSAIGIKAIICCPLVKQGILRALMAVHQTTARRWTPGDVSLVEEVAERCWAIIERTRAEEAACKSEELYRTFINATDDMAYLKDDKFRYLIVNRKNAAFLGKDTEEIIGKDDFDIMPAEAAAECRRSDGKALQENSVTISKETVNGKIYETRKFPVSLADGHTGVGGFIRDITELFRAEEKINKLNAELEQKVEERTAELRKTIAQLEETNRIFVGRELKMAQLKERIAELERRKI